MSDNNGRITSRQVIDASLYVIAALLGLLWLGMEQRVDQVSATTTANTVEVSKVKTDLGAKWDEVLRRLDRIESKLDKTPRGF